MHRRDLGVSPWGCMWDEISVFELVWSLGRSSWLWLYNLASAGSGLCGLALIIIF